MAAQRPQEAAVGQLETAATASSAAAVGGPSPNMPEIAPLLRQVSDLARSGAINPGERATIKGLLLSGTVGGVEEGRAALQRRHGHFVV